MVHLLVKEYYDISHFKIRIQIIDYISWAIFRKYEHKDNSYYNKIDKYLIKTDEVTKGRTTIYYRK